ncbi:MAG: DUF4976 domain-containing protein [Deltaproteobacteria bacterium]|nr:DUF4976 domain-containing protein [Deltaproteobacteria bacterium]
MKFTNAYSSCPVCSPTRASILTGRNPAKLQFTGHVSGGTTCDEPVISEDLYPTIMEMIGKGVEPAEDIDGLSLVPLLLGKNNLNRNQLCWYYPHYSLQARMPGYAIRKGDFKLIEHYDPAGIELFNLRDDLSEKQNLAESFPGKVEELKQSFNGWLKRMNPVMHTLNPDYKEGYRNDN